MDSDEGDRWKARALELDNGLTEALARIHEMRERAADVMKELATEEAAGNAFAGICLIQVKKATGTP